jgi:hypothetical protein
MHSQPGKTSADKGHSARQSRPQALLTLSQTTTLRKLGASQAPHARHRVRLTRFRVLEVPSSSYLFYSRELVIYPSKCRHPVVRVVQVVRPRHNNTHPSRSKPESHQASALQRAARPRNQLEPCQSLLQVQLSVEYILAPHGGHAEPAPADQTSYSTPPTRNILLAFVRYTKTIPRNGRDKQVHTNEVKKGSKLRKKKKKR